MPNASAITAAVPSATTIATAVAAAVPNSAAITAAVPTANAIAASVAAPSASTIASAVAAAVPNAAAITAAVPSAASIATAVAAKPSLTGLALTTDVTNAESAIISALPSISGLALTSDVTTARSTITSAISTSQDVVTAAVTAAQTAINTHTDSDTASLASQASVNAITTNTVRGKPTLLSQIAYPQTGTATYEFDLTLYSITGALDIPDALPTVHTRNAAGVSMDSGLGSTTMTQIAPGRYSVQYTLTTTAVPSEMLIDYAWAVSGILYYATAAVDIVYQYSTDFSAADRIVLQGIASVMPGSVVAAKTDIPSVVGLALTSDVTDAEATIVEAISEAITSVNTHTDTDTNGLGDAITKIDSYLDATISSRMVGGTVTVGAYATGQDVSTALTNQGLTVVRAAKLDSIPTTVVSSAAQASSILDAITALPQSVIAPDNTDTATILTDIQTILTDIANGTIGGGSEAESATDMATKYSALVADIAAVTSNLENNLDTSITTILTDTGTLLDDMTILSTLATTAQLNAAEAAIIAAMPKIRGR